MNEGYADRPNAQETAADTRDYPMASNRFLACQRAPEKVGRVALNSCAGEHNRPIPIRQDRKVIILKSMTYLGLLSSSRISTRVVAIGSTLCEPGFGLTIATTKTSGPSDRPSSTSGT